MPWLKCCLCLCYCAHVRPAQLELPNKDKNKTAVPLVTATDGPTADFIERLADLTQTVTDFISGRDPERLTDLIKTFQNEFGGGAGEGQNGAAGVAEMIPRLLNPNASAAAEGSNGNNNLN